MDIRLLNLFVLALLVWVPALGEKEKTTLEKAVEFFKASKQMTPGDLPKEMNTSGSCTTTGQPKVTHASQIRVETFEDPVEETKVANLTVNPWLNGPGLTFRLEVDKKTGELGWKSIGTDQYGVAFPRHCTLREQEQTQFYVTKCLVSYCAEYDRVPAPSDYEIPGRQRQPEPTIIPSCLKIGWARRYCWYPKEAH